MSDAVLSETVRPGIRLVMLKRRERLNAMNDALVAGLYVALADAAADATCRAFVLSGAGRGF